MPGERVEPVEAGRNHLGFRARVSDEQAISAGRKRG